MVKFLELKMIIILYFVFGLIWIALPKCMLSLNTKLIDYDNVHTHMTRSYGLTLLLASFIGIIAIMSGQVYLTKLSLKIYIIYSLLLIMLQLYANNQNNSLWDHKKHLKIGTSGLIMTIIICLIGLYKSKA